MIGYGAVVLKGITTHNIAVPFRYLETTTPGRTFVISGAANFVKSHITMVERLGTYGSGIP